MHVRVAEPRDSRAIVALCEELERVHREHHPDLYRPAEAFVIDATP